jgi:ubiquinone/menaquinone biosynthesis C-methylase UbiE
MARGVIEGKEAFNYDNRMKASNRHADSIKKFILQNVKTGKVCDLCCGTGINIDILQNRVSEITGVDLSTDMIDICRKKFRGNKKVKLYVASATDTKLDAGYFDCVIIRMGMHHIRDKKSLVEEASRILKPNGKFIVIDKYYLSIFELYLKSLVKFIKIGKFTALEEYIVSKEKNDEILSQKFNIIKRSALEMSKEHIGQAFMYVLNKKIN